MNWFDDFDTQIQSDEWPQPPEEINPEEYDDWVLTVERANFEAQNRWYDETFWSDFLEQMTYAND